MSKNLHSSIRILLNLSCILFLIMSNNVSFFLVILIEHLDNIFIEIATITETRCSWILIAISGVIILYLKLLIWASQTRIFKNLFLMILRWIPCSLDWFSFKKNSWRQRNVIHNCHLSILIFIRNNHNFIILEDWIIQLNQWNANIKLSQTAGLCS